MNDFTSDNDIFWSGQWDDGENVSTEWDDITASEYEIEERQYEEIEAAGESEEIAKSIKSITDLLEKIEKNTSDGKEAGSEIANQSQSGSTEESGSAEESDSSDGKESDGRNQSGEQRETEGETESTTDEYWQIINAGFNDIKVELQNTQKLMEQQILNDRLYAEVGIGVLSIIAGMIIVQIAVGRLR